MRYSKVYAEEPDPRDISLSKTLDDYLARMERVAGNYSRCLLYATRAADIERDDFNFYELLFIDEDIYAWGAEEEYALCLWHTHRKSAAHNVWGRMLNGQKTLPHTVRRRMELNLKNF